MLIDNVIKMLVSTFLANLCFVKKLNPVSYKFKVIFSDNSVMLMKGDVSCEENEIIEKEK